WQLIGGVGHIVEIDESSWTKRKYNRGRAIGNQWVFGGTDRDTGECFAVTVDRRDAATLLPIIKYSSFSETQNMSDLSIKKDYFSLTSDIKIYYELRCSSSSSSTTSSTKLVMIMGAHSTLRLFDEQVEYLSEHYPSSIEILTFDHRGVGNSKSGITAITIVRQTSTLLAHDVRQLINYVWGDQAAVHVLGVSLGGMIAQELAVLLASEQRLLSLYLGITIRGSYMRPMALLPKWVFSRIILPYFAMKPDDEQMIRSLVPIVFNGVEEQEMEELIQKWLIDFNKWFFFRDIEGCSQQHLILHSHYLTDEHAQQIRDSQAPITVQISMQDKVLPPKKQQELADLLHAKTVILESAGHMFNKQNQLIFNQSILQHIQNATS
ncbi:unnamed protein product, partial [Didymodactylos carnosus]